MAAWDKADWQALFAERAAISEHDGGMARQLAELGAYKACVEEAQRQNPGMSRAEAVKFLEQFGVLYPHK